METAFMALYVIDAYFMEEKGALCLICNAILKIDGTKYGKKLL
jgi:hypothetical protein